MCTGGVQWVPLIPPARGGERQVRKWTPGEEEINHLPQSLISTDLSPGRPSVTVRLLMRYLYKLFVLLLLYAIATVFLLYHGNDMIHELRRRKPEPTILSMQGIFNLPHHMIWEEVAFDDAVSYTQQGKWLVAQLNVMAMTGFVPLSPGSPTQCLN